MMPSTFATATIGGFVAGGSGGIGSCTWGALRDFGNIIRLRVVTMEAEPRVLDLTGDELPRVSHAFGTNGIITEIEMPLAPAYDWNELLVAFDDFTAAATFAQDVANEDGILIKLATVIEAPIGKRYFQRVAPHVEEGTNLVILLVAPHSFEGLKTFMKAHETPGAIIYNSADNDWPKTPGALPEYTWNHTTLRALKVDPSITYLQVRYRYPDHMALVQKVRETFGAEVLQHLEVMRENGKVMFAGLPIVAFSTPERLEEIVADARGDGLHDLQPAPLHAGGRRASVHRCAAVELQAGGGPQGPAQSRQDDRLGRAGFRLCDHVRIPRHDAEARGRGVRGFAAFGVDPCGGQAPRTPRAYFEKDEGRAA
jgi:hypothetical protein